MASGSDGGDYKQVISADPTGFIAAWKQATGAASSGADAIKGSVGQLGDAFGTLLGPLKAVAGVLAGGAFFKEAIDASKALTGEAVGLAKSLGITGTEAATLRTALHDIGSDSDTYISAFQKFARQLKNNEAGLQAMGLQTRDANGHLRDSNTLFTEALGLVGEYAPGLDQTTAAMTLFGKSVGEAMTLQKLNSKVIEEARQKNQDLFLNLTQEGVDSTKKYSKAMNGVGDVFLGIKNVIAQAVMPIFTQLATWFNDIGPTAVFAFKVAIDVLATALQAVILVIKTVWNVLRALADPLFTFGSALKLLISGDLTGATNKMMEMGKNWGSALGGVFDKIKADAASTATEIGNLWGKGTEASPAGKGTKRMKDFGDTNGGQAAATSRVSEWEAELAQRKAALERQGMLEGQYRELSKADELAYWQAIGGMQGLNDSERIAVTRKTAETEMQLIKQSFEVRVATLQAEAAAYKNNTDKRLELEREIQSKYQAGTKEYEASAKKIVEIQRQAADQEKQIRDSRTQAERDARLQVLALEEQTVQTAAQLGIVTAEQELQAQANFENRRNQIAREALQQRLEAAQLDPDRNPVELEKIQREIEQLEQQHQLRLGGIRQQQIKTVLAPITDTFATIQSSWSSLLQQVATGSISLGGFVKGVFMSVGQAVIGTLSDIAAKWAINAILSRILSKTTAAGEIAANAGVAGAAATASAAAIPFYGWAIAPEAGAAAFAAAMSYLPSISAAGGFDVPGNVNPIIQAHAREVVLPQKLSDAFREGADRLGGGGGGSPEVVLPRGMSARDFYITTGGAMVEAIKQAHRNFKF